MVAPQMAVQQPSSAKMRQDAPRERFRLAGGHRHRFAGGLQSGQQFGDAGVDGVFKDAFVGVIFAEGRDGAGGVGFAQA